MFKIGYFTKLVNFAESLSSMIISSLSFVLAFYVTHSLIINEQNFNGMILSKSHGFCINLIKIAFKIQ